MRLTTRRAVLLALCSIALIVHSQVRGDLEVVGGACRKEANCGYGNCHAGHREDETCPSGFRCYVGKANPETFKFESCVKSPNAEISCHAGAKTEPEDPIVCTDMRIFDCDCQTAPGAGETTGGCNLTVAGCGCSGDEDDVEEQVQLESVLCFNL